MKKIFIILAVASLMAMCSTKKGSAGSRADKATVQYRDDFRAASDKEKTALLKKLNAAAEKYSVLILTSNFKGEKITVTNSASRLYSGYPMSNLKTGIAETTRIDNTLDTRIYDDLTKKEAVIEAKEAQKHKFIYLMKNPGNENPFVITYSNKLRPLE